MKGTGDFFAIDLTVACGQSLSPAFDFEGFVMMGIITPACINCATSLTFQVSDAVTGCKVACSTFVNAYDDCGNELTLTVAASRAVAVKVDALALSPFRFIKLRMGTSACAVTACGATTFKILMKG